MTRSQFSHDGISTAKAAVVVEHQDAGFVYYLLAVHCNGVFQANILSEGLTERPRGPSTTRIIGPHHVLLCRIVDSQPAATACRIALAVNLNPIAGIPLYILITKYVVGIVNNHSNINLICLRIPA